MYAKQSGLPPQTIEIFGRACVTASDRLCWYFVATVDLRPKLSLLVNLLAKVPHDGSALKDSQVSIAMVHCTAL